jgi:Glycosyl hydrolases family 25
MKTGADISHHQQNFDARGYKDSGEDFVILKATEGRTHVDDRFRARWDDAGQQHLPRAAYHFAHPSDSVNDQADHFIQVVQAAGVRAGDAWALDLEVDEGQSAAQLVDWADKWVKRVQDALGGVGLFYSSTGFITGQMGSPGHIPGGALSWVARFNASIQSPWEGLQRPAGFPDPPAVWQRTDGVAGRTKSVASVGLCDFNEMTDEAFATLFEGPGIAQEDDMTGEQARQLEAIFQRVKNIEAAIIVPGTTSAEQAFNLLFARVRNIENMVEELKNRS